MRILVGLILGLAWGVINKETTIDSSITIDYIKPLGKYFLEVLKYLAIPLVFFSVAAGVLNLKNVSKLSRIGLRTVVLYIATTIVAIIIGIVVVNIVQPGNSISEETRTELLQNFNQQVSAHQSKVNNYKSSGWLQTFIADFPQNIVSKMLHIVLFSLVLGIVLISIGEEKSRPIADFFQKANNLILKALDYFMLTAPFGVFGLIAALVVETSKPDLFFALLQYSATVLIGLLLMAFLIYPLLLKFFTNMDVPEFFRGIRPAQLLAFSSSSSSATLPVTMKQCERSLKLPEQVTSFVLPLGATINMDGTSLYQAIAAIFIAQTYGIDLSFTAQLSIILLAIISSIGSAGVPGAGMIMLSIILESEHLPLEGIALIMAPDRILDMCRTVVNVTGDATVATMVASKEAT